ncbi:MAG: ABC-F family ATP-binding cassette domain-containing protein [Anaerolineales bacterium]|nr:ABC-F family ATP-binding cassette domain-containing protein [Anaerolineales bacterium]
MLTAHHLSKTYGIQPILQDISFSISAGERIGLVGPNGCGKTTLLRILVGEEKPDKGTVAHTRSGLRIGYLAQGMNFGPDQTLRSALNLATVAESDLESEVATLAASLAKDPENPILQQRYDAAVTKLSTFNIKPESILGPLGLGDFDLDTPIAHLSGGQKTRLMLARILLEEPHLLLLDEPTNHLDIAMLEWLEGWLNHFNGAVLIVSHDRAFLDNTVTSILELDPATQSVKSYPGNYSDYAEQKLVELEKQQQAYVDQQQQIAQLRAAAAHIRGLTKMRKGGKADPANTDGFSVGFFGNRATKNVAGRAKHIEARIEKILTEERVEKPRSSWQIKLDFGEDVRLSKDVLTTENLSVGYPGHEPLLENLNLYIRAGQRIALTGENGAGKTTLLRTIAGTLEPLAGAVRLGQTVRLGYMAQEQELLDASLSALQTIQRVAAFNETQARHFLHFFLFSGDDPLRPSGELSFGERARLQLALLVAQGCTFLLLDEPINHLDIPSRARFEQALTQFSGSILAVVHDRYFIERFATHIWLMENKSIRRTYEMEKT